MLRPRFLRAAALVLAAIVFSGCQNSEPNQTNRESVATDRESVDADFTGIRVINDYGQTKQPQLGKFTDLPASLTGIDYPHIWNPPKIFRNLIAGVFGNGVAIGDYDNDGWQDVFIGRQHEAGRLYKNLSGMQFKDVTEEVGISPKGAWCVGTTFVDINNDGKLDLYLCCYERPNRLYINEGGKFRECAKEYGLDFKGSSIVMNFADYDLDGDLDGYLVTNLKVIQKKKKSKIQVIRQPGSPPEVAPEYKETLFLIKHPDGTYRRSRAGQFDYFFRNDNGKFVDATDDVGIGMQPYIGLSSAWWDYNDDGWPDLYVANDFKGPDFLYRNNGPDEQGKVTFTDVSKTAFPHTPWYSMGSDFADINNDGLLDYLASDMAGTNHYRDKLSMGSMSGPGSNAWFLNAVDPPQYMRNAMYLNTGTERFSEIAYLSGLAKTDWTWTVKFADFDNDGWQDVFFTNGMTRDLFNSDLRNEIDEKIAAAKSADKNADITTMALDFWEQQQPYRLENMAFQNLGDYKFKDVGAKWGLDHLGVSMAAAVGDLDNDGDLDVVVNGFEEPVKIYRNDLSIEKSIRFLLRGKKNNRHGLGARIDIESEIDSETKIQTRYLSPTRGFMSTCENIAHFGIGNLDSVDRVRIRWPGGLEQVFENLATGKLYLITENESDAMPRGIANELPMFAEAKKTLEDFKHIETEFDDFERQPLLPNKHSQLGPCLAWGDVDADGIEELFMGGAKGYVGKLLKRNDNGGFSQLPFPALDIDKNSEDMGAVFIDSDSDGDMDLFVVSGGVECDPGDAALQDRLYVNDGNGKFSKSENSIPPLNESGAAVAAVDFDKDGDLDLVVGGRIVPGRYPESPKSFLLENNNGKFTDATAQKAAGLARCGLVTGLVWSDIDGDDWQDLLVATEWGPVKVFKNQGGRLTDVSDDAGTSRYLGWYNSICAGDIDCDGDMDYVVGNVGLNTKYKASPEKPELLFYGDFEGMGRKRIVEAKYENGVCLPRRGLSCSSHAMPMIKEKTPTFHEFAISSLNSLYTEEKLDEANRFEANTLDSLILINESKNGKPRFKTRKLPRLAQMSPIFGCQLVDVNADGYLDIYAVQNFYGPQRETGYFDGGVSMLMLGDGTGNFEPISPRSSGLVVSGDAKSLTIIDIDKDGRPDFVVGKNNSSPQCFINKIGGEYFEIPDKYSKLSFGSKLKTYYSDGSQQLWESGSSQGYLSQSTSNWFFGKGNEKRQLLRIEIHLADGTSESIPVAPSPSDAQISKN